MYKEIKQLDKDNIAFIYGTIFLSSHVHTRKKRDRVALLYFSCILSTFTPIRAHVSPKWDPITNERGDRKKQLSVL